MEVSNQIIEVLDKIAQQFGVAIDWTSKNVVPYIKELCSKYTTYNIICCIIGTVIGFLLIVVPQLFSIELENPTMRMNGGMIVET